MDSIAQRVLQKRQGSSLNSDAIAQRVLQKMGTRNRPPIQENENYKRAVAEAERYKQEAERAKSPLGFSWNAVKALPRAIGDTLVGTPAKFIASTAEVPGTLLRGGKTTQREYKVPGLSPFKSYQSDFEKVAGDVIEGRAGLGRAAWEMAKVPLAGLEMYGVGKGLQNVYKSGNVLARTPSAKAAKEVAYDIADTFLPTTRGMGAPNTSQPRFNVDSLPVSQGRTFSAPRRMITSGSRILRESGLGGRALEQLIRKQQLDADLMTGGYNKRISEALSGLSKAERVNVTDVLEGTAKPLSQKAKDAAMKMRSLYDEIAGEATKREFTIRTPDGGDVPFRPRENYAPRMYNWDDFTKGRRREEALQHLVDTGQARNKAEAAKALDTFIQENAQRRAGNLENARMFDLPGYEKDADIAGRAYAQRAADRFTQADIFGKKDEVPAALINKIANEGGDYQEAQRVFDFLFQGLPKSKIASAVTQFNLATKLDLGAITNITQSVNTATKAGILNTAKAIFKGFTKEGKDFAELANVYDEMVIVQETGLKMNRFVKAVMKPFQIVERFNRRTAGMAGKLRAEQLARVLKKNPDSAIAFRQLKSLGIDPSKIINGKLTGKDVLTAANRMSELTQFKPNVLNTPVAWRTPIGRVLMQFKSFAYMQTRFITDEIAGEARRGNIAPLLRFILAAGIISPLAYNTRNLVAGRDENDQKKSLDTRKLDKYFGAGKSFFTEPITQGAFLGETFTNPNTTSMKKLARTLGTFGGPTAGEFGNTLTSLESADRTKTVNKNWYENHELAQDDPWLMAKRQAVGSVPFVGEYLKNTAYGFEDTPAEQAEKIIKEGIKNGDFDKIAEGLSIDPYYKKPNAFRNLIKEVSEENTPIEKDQEIFYELQKRKLKPFFTP